MQNRNLNFLRSRDIHNNAFVSHRDIALSSVSIIWAVKVILPDNAVV